VRKVARVEVGVLPGLIVYVSFQTFNRWIELCSPDCGLQAGDPRKPRQSGSLSYRIDVTMPL
jgi:hypothetical protein